MIGGRCLCGAIKFEIEKVVALLPLLRMPQGERGVVCHLRARPPRAV